MKEIFNHESLEVYQRAMMFYARVKPETDSWDERHSIKDHLPRAAASVVENIATSSAAYSQKKLTAMDYSMGSVLECAACLDIAEIKGLLTVEVMGNQKEALAELYRMLFGMRRTRAAWVVRETPAPYGADTGVSRGQELFHHERLEIYRVAIAMIRSFCRSEDVCVLPSKLFRKLDALATSIPLNIAEGNSRRSGADHRRFIEIAHEAAIKMATQLDIVLIGGLLSERDIVECKEKLLSITKMGAALMNSLKHG